MWRPRGGGTFSVRWLLRRRYTTPIGETTGDENANLYMRGVNEGRSGDLLEASDLLDILDVFGEDGMRSYLMGVIEGKADKE